VDSNSGVKLYSAREQTELIIGVGTARPPLRKTNEDGPSPPRPMGQMEAQTVAAPSITQNDWLDHGALTDAGNALNERRFRDLEANPHASVMQRAGRRPGGRLPAWNPGLGN
jgi:hypothetical protein